MFLRWPPNGSVKDGQAHYTEFLLDGLEWILQIIGYIQESKNCGSGTVLLWKHNLSSNIYRSILTIQAELYREIFRTVGVKRLFSSQLINIIKNTHGKD